MWTRKASTNPTPSSTPSNEKKLERKIINFEDLLNKYPEINNIKFNFFCLLIQIEADVEKHALGFV